MIKDIDRSDLENARSQFLIDMLKTYADICTKTGNGTEDPLGITSVFNVMGHVGQAALEVVRDQHAKIRTLEARLEKLEKRAP